MPSIERDAPRDQDRPMKHQHAASIDIGRALVPMWDSSDPERAPPPLPLNPQSPGVSRTGTSSAIQSAHAAMAEKARENAALVPHLPKRVDTSPERSASGLRPSSHRRMQSLQPSSVKDMSFMLESASGRESPQSAPRSPEKMDRPSTPQRRDTRDVFVEPRDERQDRSATSTPVPGPSLTPIIRPTALRRPQSSILGENAPPQSATMLALQNMSTQASSSSNSAPVSPLKEPENPLADITNGSKALVKPPGSLDSLSSQILSLTDIATTLQKEMSLLSRRSRDNATDLLSLKEATNTRDEDIRKSLRELMAEAKARAANNTRDPYGGPLLLEGRHPSSPTLSKTARPFSLPRIPSPNSFAASFDRESLLSTPSLVSDAPPATSGLLDKIMRDMGTREGQEMLLGRLAELADRLSGMASAAKVEELLRFLKSNQQQAVVPRAGGADGSSRGRNWSFDEDDTMSRRSALDYLQAAASQSSRSLPGQDSRSNRGTDGLGDDVLQAIRSVKDSVAQGGGLTAETKALVRELRGEVLGMGREIGRRLDEVAEQSPGGAEGVTKAEMARVVEEGLSEMSQQMNSLLREHRRQSTSTGGTVSPRESSIDYKEIYNSVRAALKDTQATKPRSPELRREDVVQAVKDAWEKYKPEIEIQQIGLERDEVLACLQEGLRAYAPRDDRPPGATRDEVFQAVTDGLKHYVPPKVEIPPALSRDEILDAVRECLEEFEFPVAPGMGNDFTREDMLDAVKEGLHSFDFPTPPPPAPVSHVTRNDVLDAVTQGLHGFDFSNVNSNALVPQSVSKGDVSDAVKSGLKSLDLSSDILDAVKEGLETSDLPTNVLQVVMQGIQSFDFAAAIPRPDLSRVDVADAVKEGIESLDFNNSVTNAVKQALKGFDFSSAHSSSALVPHSDVSRALPSNNEDVADAVKEGLKSVDLSKDVSEAVTKALEAFDFSTFSSAVVSQPEFSRGDVVSAVKEGLDTTNLFKDVAHAVREVLESFDFPSSSAPAPASSGPDLSRGDVVDAVKEGLDSLNLSTGFGDAVKKELNAFDFSAIQSTALAAPGSGNSEDVMQRLQEIKELLQGEIKAASEETKQNIAANALGTEQVLDATKDGFEKLRQEMEDYVDRAKSDSGSEQAVDQLLDTLDGFREDLTELITRSSDNSRTFLKSEVDSIRDMVNSSMVPALPQQLNNKELIEALQDGLQGLRSEISTRPIAGLTEILDALQEGLGDIRTSLNNLRDKPADLTANDEILEALKEGLDSLRSDIDSLREEKQNDRALATISDDTKAVVQTEQTLKHDDIKNLEALITQLGVKVEALESTPKPEVSSISKEDLAEMEKVLRDVAESVSSMPNREPLETLEESIRKIQETVDDLATKGPAPLPRSSTDAASREDVEAIETILRNTKGRLDDLMDGEQAVRKDHIDGLETLILEARESVNGLSSQFDVISRKEHIDALGSLLDDTRQSLGGLATQMDSLSRKEDVAMVESLVNQVVASFDEMKERHEKALEDPEKITKTDVEAVEAVCLDTKSLVEHIQKVDLVNLPSKEDIESLELRLGDVKDKLDAQADANTKGFEERQAEIVGVSVAVTEVKTALDEFQSLVRSKFEDGGRGIDSIHTLLDALGEGVRKNDNISDDIKELLDTVKLEFEDSKTGLVGVKLELDEKLQSAAESMLAKLDERMAELMTKHEELQLTQDERAAKGEERDSEMEAAMAETKTIAEELKSLVDTLGGAVTESMEKVEESSKTVFERVDDLVSKSDDNHADNKVEHQLTREQVQEAIGKVEGLHGQVSEYQPKILESVQEVMMVLAQHYENLKTSTLAIQERVEHPMLPLPPEKYDDTVVHEKLDALVGHTLVAGKAFEQLDTLDQVHAQVKATAAELAAFLAAQTQRIADEHEDREKSLQETTITLERRREEMEQVEALLATLRDEEARLKETITVTLPEEQSKINEQFLSNMISEEFRLKEATTTLIDEQARLKETFLTALHDEQARLTEANVALKDEHDLLKETFMASLKEEQARQAEANAALKEEQEQLKETFLNALKEEQARLMETNVALKEEQEQLKDTFLTTLKEEQARIMETNVALKEEQDQMKETFLANLKDEQARLMESNVALKGEQDVLKEQFLASLREEEGRLKEINETLREEHQSLKDAFLANLHDEAALLKESNAHIKEEQDRLRESFVANFKEEEQRLREANEALRLEQEQMKTTLKEEQERFKVELLANLMEEETHLKEANAALREEQELLRADFLATLKEDESRIKDSLEALRSEQEGLSRQKTRLNAELSSLDTALRLRREELHDMEARAESLERRILEGVMDHSRVLLMAKTNRGSVNGSRDTMSRKRVASSQRSAHTASEANGSTSGTANNSKSRSAINMAMSARSKANTPNGTPASSNRRILSLSQITNNVPSGGMKRSQSVRTAGGAAAARGLKKSTWAPPVPALPIGAAKGYGDLKAAAGDGMGGDDKENAVMDHHLHEGEEDAYHDQHQRDVSSSKPPVDIVISEPTITTTSEPDVVNISVTPGEHQNARGEETEDDEQNFLDAEEDRFSDLGEEAVDMDGEDEEGDDARSLRSLRRASHGTTVITPADEESRDEEEREGDGDIDDAASDWTESVVGRESEGSVDAGVGGGIETGVPVAAAS